MPVWGNSGIAAVLCAVIVTTGGCLSGQHERRDPKGGQSLKGALTMGSRGSFLPEAQFKRKSAVGYFWFRKRNPGGNRKWGKEGIFVS